MKPKKNQLLEAQDPQTPQERLKQLAKSKRAEVLTALIRNPNTPLAILLRLMHRDPEGFVSNPAVPLGLLESPDLLRMAPMGGLRALVKVPNLPEWLMVGFSVLTSACKIALLAEPNIHPKLLFVFAQDSALSGFLVKYNTAPPELLAQLLVGADIARKESIAIHPNTSAETLALLLTEEDPKIRAALARNRKAPQQLLRTLSKDASAEVRLAVSKNSCTDLEVLSALALDKTAYVCQGVASNPNASARLLQVISNGEHSYFCRLALALHPKTPLKVLQNLLKDSNEHVREAAKQNLGRV